MPTIKQRCFDVLKSSPDIYFRTPEIAEIIGSSVPSVTSNLKALFDAGAAERKSVSAPTGGVNYQYRFKSDIVKKKERPGITMPEPWWECLVKIGTLQGREKQDCVIAAEVDPEDPASARSLMRRMTEKKLLRKTRDTSKGTIFTYSITDLGEQALSLWRGKKSNRRKQLISSQFSIVEAKIVKPKQVLSWPTVDQIRAQLS